MRLNKPTVHLIIEKITLPLPILERHKNIHLLMEKFYVNGFIFLHTNTGNINFLSVKLLTSKVAKSFIKFLEEMKQNMIQEVSI